jgi:hypothetical protein
MTEDEWLNCTNPHRMLDFLGGEVAVLVDQVPPQQQEAERRHLLAIVSPRKRWLFGVACCRQVWDLLTVEASRQAVETAERYIDGLVDYQELWRAADAAMAARDAIRVSLRDANREAARRTRSAAIAAMMAVRLYWGAAADESATAARWAGLVPSLDAARVGQADLLRDIVGNPFRPTLIAPEWIAWDDGVVARLAAAAYEERGFSAERMGELADALRDAGCREAALLDHLRGPGPHVRGCWAVDVLSGRAGGTP